MRSEANETHGGRGMKQEQNKYIDIEELIIGHFDNTLNEEQEAQLEQKRIDRITPTKAAGTIALWSMLPIFAFFFAMVERPDLSRFAIFCWVWFAGSVVVFFFARLHMTLII